MPELSESIKKQRRAEVAKWKALVANYQKPSVGRATWQLVNTLGPLFLLWVAMYFTVQFSWLATVPLAVLAGGFVIRAFIIFHDCGHRSFLKSAKANDFWGFVCGIFTFTPYYHWRWEHSVHHATSGDLDRRGIGDIWTMTVAEYDNATPWKRFTYRMVRNPIVLFVIAPVFVFMIRERFPSSGASRRDRNSVWWMNVAILSYVAIMVAIFGWANYLILQLIVSAVASSAGVWLFYVQHQFEDAYWERGDEWDYTTAAIKGSSFYKLPKVLQWFSGNIGFHHIHHLSPRIPNYNLERCHKSDPMFNEVKPLTLFASFKSLTYRLWDEAEKKLITFGEYKARCRKELERGAVSGHSDFG